MPAQQQGAQTDQTMNFFWLLCVIVIVFLSVWYFRPQWVVIPVFWLRIHEIELLRFTADLWNDFVQWLPFLHLPHADVSELTKWANYMAQTTPKHVDFSKFELINDLVGRWMQYPIGLILISLGTYGYFSNNATRFRHIYSMKSLKKTENEIWPQITPVLSLDLVKQDLDEGPWAMSRLPLDFAKDHDLLYVSENNGKKIWQVDTGKAQHVFAMQLGRPWQGAQNLPIHIKALLVIFLARAERKRDLAKTLMVQISRSATSGKLDFTGVEEALPQFKNSKIIPWLEKRHAYVGTLMSSLLEIGRSDGVLATAEFLWLKPVDRWLWYVLNNVGRRTAFSEIAGVHSHWLAEKKIGRALRVPVVKEAAKALALYMDDLLFVDEGEKWQTKEA